MQMYSEADVDSTVLQGQRIAILGYGSQGRAHALNLRDSGHDVVVGLRRDGASWAKAEADGLAVQEPADAVQDAAIVAFLFNAFFYNQLYQHSFWTLVCLAFVLELQIGSTRPPFGRSRAASGRGSRPPTDQATAPALARQRFLHS